MLISPDCFESLLPDDFIDEDCNIRKIGMKTIYLFRDIALSYETVPNSSSDVCVPCFLPERCTDSKCQGTISLSPNKTNSIVVVTEQGKKWRFMRPIFKEASATP